MEPKTTKKPSRKLVVFKRELPFYLMLIPGVTFLIIFSYLPMFGLVMAFQDFTPLRSFKNSPWVGLKNFRDMLALPTFWNVVGNTLSISIAKIILRLLVPLILALLLNEVVRPKFMRMAQTVFFLPYFLSWAVMGGVLRNLFQYDGMVNELLGRIGIDPIMFLGSNTWFPIIIILSDVWKDMGYNMIIFLAAITGTSPCPPSAPSWSCCWCFRSVLCSALVWSRSCCCIIPWFIRAPISLIHWFTALALSTTNGRFLPQLV